MHEQSITTENKIKYDSETAQRKALYEIFALSLCCSIAADTETVDHDTLSTAFKSISDIAENAIMNEEKY